MLKTLKKGFTLKHSVNKGFTLIELLVTIGVLAVVAAGVLAAIDPVDKLRAGTDGRAQANIGQVATGLNTYAAVYTYFPSGTVCGADNICSTWAELTTPLQTELGPMPQPATGYTYGTLGTATGDAVIVYSRLLSKKYEGTTTSRCNSTAATADTAWWMWYKTVTGGTGPACGTCTADAATVPTTASTCTF
ncbi:hypothetical protein A2899_01855 [Candidatus Amesbacteria bacterium RIFCSPLOWO2_01_FULL_49_25]|nr:MAG: hypothetical protein A2899_01855 [Candidatus Amesbacteria bacterium RIFCSPLOWO2_01_FULL_49_25]